MEFASAIVLMAAMVISGVVQACATGRIGPNPIAGIRMPSVMASSEAWRAGHQAALLATWSTSALAALFAAYSMFAGTSQAQMSVFVLIGAAILLVGLVWGAVVAHRAAVEVTERITAAEAARRARLANRAGRGKARGKSGQK